MKRRHVWPEGHWGWPIKVTHKHGLRAGDMLFVGGQCDLDTNGNVQHPNDLHGQTRSVIGHIRTVLEQLDSGLDDLVKLVVYYANDGTVDEHAMLVALRSALGKGPMPVVSTVPMPFLAYPSMVVEIDSIAMRASTGGRMTRVLAEPKGRWAWPKDAFFPQGVRCGRMIYVGGQQGLGANGRIAKPGDIVAQSHDAMQNALAVLAEFGADANDSVKFNAYYRGHGTAADWEKAARGRASYFTEPGPAATGIPLPRFADAASQFQIELWAMLGEDGRRLTRIHSWPEGHWDWPIHLPYKHGLKCDEMIFLGGQVALTPKAEVIQPGDTPAQTRIAMANIAKVLAVFGARLDDIVKVNAFYEGTGTADNLHDNLAIRSASFMAPGPVTTGVPLPTLAYPKMMIEIDTIAMV